MMPLGKSGNQTNTNINTGGGAYINGNVSTNGGDFVGRDKIVINLPKPAGLFHNVPSKPHTLIGRDLLLKNIVDRLLSPRTLSMSFEGLPGIGKTTLAIAVGYDKRVLEHFTDGVLWAGLGMTPNVLSQLASWADATKTNVTNTLDKQEISDAIKNKIGQGRYLLIIDDAWDIKDANLLKCGGPNCCHILTTRHKEVARKFSGTMQMTEIPELSSKDAFDFLGQLAPEALTSNIKSARELLALVGYLPLAIELLGGYLANYKFPEQVAPAVAQLRQPEERLKLLTERLGSHTKGKEFMLEEVIKLSLSDLSTEIQRVFYSFGAFAPKPAAFSLDATLYVSATSSDNLVALINRNLITRQGNDLFNIHQSISDVAQRGVTSESRTRHREFYLNEVIKDPNNWRYIETIYPQLQFAWENAPKDAQILDFIRVLRPYQERRSLFDNLRTWHLACLEIVDQNNKAELLTHIGATYLRHDYYEQAIEYCQQALSIYENIDDQSGLVKVFNTLAAIYRTTGEYQDALSYLERALRIQEEIGDRTSLAGTFANMGMTFKNIGNYSEALTKFQHALPLYEDNSDMSGVAVVLNEIGRTYFLLGEHKQALDYFEKALPIRQAEGAKSGIARTLNSIGEAYQALGNSQAALDYYQRALPILEEVGNRNGESVTRYNLAKIYRDAEDLNTAVEYLRQSVLLANAIKAPFLVQYQGVLSQVEAELASKT